MRYINGEEIKYDFTKPKTYMRPVFESLEDGHVRLHHIDVEGSMEKCTFARIGHMSKQRRRIFELEEENAKLRELVDAWMGCGTRYHTMKDGCPMFDENAKDFCKAEEMARELGIEVE